MAPLVRSCMRVNWREINAAKNSFAALYAACEASGYLLNPVNSPEADVTCYSLNTITEQKLRDEITAAECITVAGGPHASACYHEVAAYADYVVVGEGEYTLPQLLDYIGNGIPGAPPPGIATSGGYTPACHTVILDAYPPFTRRKGYIEITRGCPHHCTYCQTPRLFGHCMRHRSVDEIVKAASNYRDARFVTPNAFAYGSDGITPAFDKLELLLRRLDNEIYLGTFPGEVRPEFVTPESLALVVNYCANRRLHFGAQSGSDAVLEKLRRGHTVGDVWHAVDLCREYDLIPVVDFIIGLPFETDDDQVTTSDMIREISRYGSAHVHYFMPLPGTPLAGSEPRPVLREVDKTLGRLALAGKITGSWINPERRFFRQRPDSHV